MQARWQDPETGMFLSVDPVVADVADPQSTNGYRYARNNPVNATDPTGMFLETIYVKVESVDTSTYGLESANPGMSLWDIVGFARI